MIVFNLVNGTQENIEGNNVDMETAGFYKVYYNDCLTRTLKDNEVISFFYKEDKSKIRGEV